MIEDKLLRAIERQKLAMARKMTKQNETTKEEWQEAWQETRKAAKDAIILDKTNCKGNIVHWHEHDCET